MLNFIMVLFGLLCAGVACLFLDIYGLFLFVAIVGAVLVAMLMSLQKRQAQIEEKLDRLLEKTRSQRDITEG